MPNPVLPAPFLPFAALLSGETRESLQLDKPLWLTRAPGCLDLLGGPGEGPGTCSVTASLARSVYCAIQNRDDLKIRIHCIFPDSWGGSRTWEGEVGTLYTKKGPPRSQAVLEQIFSDPDDAWMMRLIASMLGLRRTRQLNTPKVGFDLVVWSRLPESEGYGHRAAFGVATALAFKASTGLAKKRVDGVQVARAVTLGAREVLGEEISMTDALTAALGRRDCLLSIEHGIDLSMQWIPLPPQCSVAAVDLNSGGHADKKNVLVAKTGALMAMAHLNEDLKKAKKPEYGSWGQITPAEFEDSLRAPVPASSSGENWLKVFKRRKGYAELVEQVDPGQSYRLRAHAEHECRESARARRFVSNMGEYARTLREGFLSEAGRCLNSSHRSLTEKCKISIPEIDDFLTEVNAAGRSEGLFGGRLGSNGRGPVAAVLVHQSSRQPLRDMVDAFCPERGWEGSVVTDTSDGGVLLGWWHGVLEPPDEPEDDADGGPKDASEGVKQGQSAQ